MTYESGDVIICIVDKIIGTIVFVKMPNGEEGTIIFSEIEAGRVKNIRDYVVPKKKIVCKVLKMQNGKTHLSLRRVSVNEKKKALEEDKILRSYKSIFKTILKDKSEETIKKISHENDFVEFIQKIRTEPKLLEKYISKEESKKIIDILQAQKPKKAEITKKIKLTTKSPNGIETIKKILGKIKDVKINYIAAGKYSIKIDDENLKKADDKFSIILENLINDAKNNDSEVQLLDK